MALDLFAHNQKAYAAAVEMLDKYGKAAIVHPTGTGKSFIAFQLVEEHPDAVVLWLSPSEYIYKTQLEAAQKVDPIFDDKSIRFYTYAKLARCTEEELQSIADLQPAYIILDELHRAGAPHWQKSVETLLRLCPEAKLLGLTATNIRYLDNNRDMTEELFDGCIASEMTLGGAIVRGILPAPKYVTTVYHYADDLLRYQKRVDNLPSKGLQNINQRYLNALRRALEQVDGMDKVFARHMEDRVGKYIVFCSNREHMREMVAHVPEWFSEIDEHPHIYKVYSLDSEKSRAFAKFKADESGHLKLLFCIDMLNEGVHVKGISGVILFRPTVSPIIYNQQIGRALTSGDLSTPLIIDAVNNFENLVSIDSLKDEMHAAAVRMYANGEGEAIVTERFEVVEEVRDCRVLFERLRNSLNNTWEQYYMAASEYAAEHGDLNIPGDYCSPAGLNVGRWIIIQRRIRAGTLQKGTLTPQQIERLDRIGMIWENRLDLAWERGYAHAKAYYEEFGNLSVPNEYCAEDGFALSDWLRKLRRARANGERGYLVTAERVEKLDALGMVWNAAGARWETFYAAAVQYYDAHGHLRVPFKYVDENGIKLGSWIREMRRRYHYGSSDGNRSALTEEQITRLTAIEMQWETSGDEQWMGSYREAKRYYELHGNLNVPVAYRAANGLQPFVLPSSPPRSCSVAYRAANGLQLHKWIDKQIELYNANAGDKKVAGKLTAERIALLEQIGICWEKKQDPWLHRYELAQEYKCRNGTLKMPAQYKSQDGIWLNRWLNRQQHLLRDENYHVKTKDAPLKDWQKQKLVELGL